MTEQLGVHRNPGRNKTVIPFVVVVQSNRFRVGCPVRHRPREQQPGRCQRRRGLVHPQRVHHTYDRSLYHTLSLAFRPRPWQEQSMDATDRLTEIERLYRQAFAEHGVIALWSSRPVPHPTEADALAITRSLRVEGNLHARRLAEQIEKLCGHAPQ